MLTDPEFVVEGAPDNAVSVDEIGHAGHPESESAGDAVEANDFLVGVGEKGEGEGKAGAESLVTFGAVGADADQVCSVSFDGFVCFTEALRLAVSASGEVLGVEIEYGGPAGPPFGEPELPAVVAEGVEIGG